MLYNGKVKIDGVSMNHFSSPHANVYIDERFSEYEIEDEDFVGNIAIFASKYASPETTNINISGLKLEFHAIDKDKFVDDSIKDKTRRSRSFFKTSEASKIFKISLEDNLKISNSVLPLLYDINDKDAFNRVYKFKEIDLYNSGVGLYLNEDCTNPISLKSCSNRNDDIDLKLFFNPYIGDLKPYGLKSIHVSEFDLELEGYNPSKAFIVINSNGVDEVIFHHGLAIKHKNKTELPHLTFFNLKQLSNTPSTLLSIKKHLTIGQDTLRQNTEISYIDIETRGSLIVHGLCFILSEQRSKPFIEAKSIDAPYLGLMFIGNDSRLLSSNCDIVQYYDIYSDTEEFVNFLIEDSTLNVIGDENKKYIINLDEAYLDVRRSNVVLEKRLNLKEMTLVMMTCEGVVSPDRVEVNRPLTEKINEYTGKPRKTIVGLNRLGDDAYILYLENVDKLSLPLNKDYYFKDFHIGQINNGRVSLIIDDDTKISESFNVEFEGDAVLDIRLSSFNKVDVVVKSNARIINCSYDKFEKEITEPLYLKDASDFAEKPRLSPTAYAGFNDEVKIPLRFSYERTKDKTSLVDYL